MSVRQTQTPMCSTLRRGQRGLLRGRLLLAAVVTLAWGCVTPVIPLPPPQSLELAVVDPAAERIQISGRASPSALVYVLNRNTRRGVIVATGEESGEFTAELSAADGDELDIWVSRFADDAPSSIRCMVVSYADGLSECE